MDKLIVKRSSCDLIEGGELLTFQGCGGAQFSGEGDVYCTIW